MFKILKSAVFAVLFGGMTGFGGMTTVATAQDLPPELLENLMNQCRPDYHRLCPDVLPGGGRVGRCLYDQQERLAPACLKSVKFAYAIKACLPDYKRYCNGLPAGDERIVSCLAQNYGGLNPECERIVRANEPYLERNYPRYSEYSSPKKYDDTPGYEYKKSYDNGYQRSYRDNYDGNGRYAGRTYYNSETQYDSRVDEEDVDREPIK